MPLLGAPERAAVLSWLSVGPGPEQPPSGGIRWDPVLQCLGFSLAALALRAMERNGAAGVPPEVLGELRDRRRLAGLKHLRQRSALRAACEALDGASIPFLALKGAALAHLVYPEPMLRSMTDLDLWVPPSRLEDGTRALSSSGLRENPDSGLAVGAASEFAAAERQLDSEDAWTHVELHGHVPSLSGLEWGSFDAAWSAGVEVTLGGFRTRVLNPRHQLAHACLHMARKHAFHSGLRHLLDVALITRRWSDLWDWPRLLREWERQGVAVWMLLALTMARDLLGAPVPRDVGSRFAGTDWDAMRAIAEEQLWEGRHHRMPPAISRVARSGSRRETMRWLRGRVFDYYWSSPEPRPLGRVLRDGSRRIWHDLTVKVPAYVRGWLRGDLRGRALEKGLALERQRGELDRLVAAATERGRPGDGGLIAPGAEAL